jgi:hypothetical protein
MSLNVSSTWERFISIKEQGEKAFVFVQLIFFFHVNDLSFGLFIFML